ncbi:MAG: prephenate dehydrogenase/arogenate dehydrogenase family protein [Bdellovibrionales bacterium]|nr:prephenate dehydrogenase/arogenate dehydrogenase family protein [Bdellovibrionales bacterium]
MGSEKQDLSLKAFRDEIDRIDHQILSLLFERLTQVDQISQWKASKGIPIKDQLREKEKIGALTKNLSDSDAKWVESIFQEIMRQSKLYQSKPGVSTLKGSVSIIGLGLMGGSLYKAIRHYHPLIEVKPFDIRSDIDAPLVSLNEALGSEYIFLCLSPHQIKEFLKQHGEKIFHESTVIDFASTKSDIANFVFSYKKFKFNFIPAHPIVGKESSGYEHSDVDLYLNKKIVICDDEEQLPKLLKEVLLGIGLKIKHMNTEDHDQSLAFTSHLPHLIALALVLSSEQQLKKDIVPQSFLDLTRISDASSSLWQDIFTSNQHYLTLAVNEFNRVLIDLLNNVDRLKDAYNKAKEIKKECLDDHSSQEIPFKKPAA